jgi:hypothetical protein
MGPGALQVGVQHLVDQLGRLARIGRPLQETRNGGDERGTLGCRRLLQQCVQRLGQVGHPVQGRQDLQLRAQRFLRLRQHLPPGARGLQRLVAGT